MSEDLKLRSGVYAVAEPFLEEIQAGRAGARFTREPKAADRFGKEEGRGVLVLPVEGLITRRASFWGTGTEELVARLGAALEDDRIGTIVLDVDSPGGIVYGVPEAAKAIRAVAEEKRVVAVTGSLAASAAYWLASAASEVVMAPSAEVGSVGVFYLHMDYSEALERAGIRATVIRRPDRKAEANRYEELTEEAAAEFQAKADAYFRTFAADVAAFRGLTPKDVEDLEGLTFLAEDALARGLVDRIATLGEVLEELTASRDTAGSRARLELPETPSTIAASAGVAAPFVHTPGRHPTAPTGQEETTMSDQDNAARDGAATHGEDLRVPASKPSGWSGKDGTLPSVEDHRSRTDEILELCSAHELGMSDARAYIQSGKTPDEVARDILARLSNGKGREVRAGGGEVPRVDMERRDREAYSLGAAMKEYLAVMANGERHRGLAHEVSEELARQSDQVRQGGLILDPTAFRASNGPRAAIDAGTATGASEFVFTEYGGFISMLRNRAVAFRMGARRLPGLVGDVAMVKQDGAGSGSWVGDDPGSDVSDSDPTTTTVALSPKIYQHSTAYSRQLERQSVRAIQAFLEEDILVGHALAVDLAVLHGSGASNQPTGIYSASGVNAVAAGGAISWPKIVEAEEAVYAANGDFMTAGYVLTPEVGGDCKTTERATGNGRYLWEGRLGEGEVNGYRAMVTNQLSKTLGTGGAEHGAVFGFWDQVIVGEWGNLEIVVDPFRLKKQGVIEITSYQTVDIALRNPEAFSKYTGLTS